MINAIIRWSIANRFLVVVLTVLLSVVLHGVTAVPLVAVYARRAAQRNA